MLLVNFLFLYAPSTAREKRGIPTADNDTSNDNERTRGSGGPFRPPSPNIIFRERILRVLKFPVTANSIERRGKVDML